MAYNRRKPKMVSVSVKKERRAKAKMTRIAEKARIERISTVFHPDVIRGTKTIGEIKGKLS